MSALSCLSCHAVNIFFFIRVTIKTAWASSVNRSTITARLCGTILSSFLMCAATSSRTVNRTTTTPPPLFLGITFLSVLICYAKSGAGVVSVVRLFLIIFSQLIFYKRSTYELKIIERDHELYFLMTVSNYRLVTFFYHGNGHKKPAHERFRRATFTAPLLVFFFS